MKLLIVILLSVFYLNVFAQEEKDTVCFLYDLQDTTTYSYSIDMKVHRMSIYSPLRYHAVNDDIIFWLYINKLRHVKHKMYKGKFPLSYIKNLDVLNLERTEDYIMHYLTDSCVIHLVLPEVDSITIYEVEYLSWIEI